jgi:pimeloyl-ACP methyl ester carboxylesterase
MKKIQILIIMIGLVFPLLAGAQDQQTTDQLVAELGKGFVSNTAKVNGTTIHYVRGGNGPAVILIHGYPQDWYEYYKIMPQLAKQFTVIAVDMRGVGGSSATPGGYDAANMAEDIRQLTQQLKLEQVYIVGHDIGGMVAYAFVRLYPKAARGVMILDVPLPGMDPWEESIAGPQFWDLAFHQVPDLPEKLVAGRQADYFRYMLDPKHFSDAEVAHYAGAYAGPDHLRAGFELYRAFPENGRFFGAQRTRIDVPLLWAAGENSFFGKIGPRIARELRAHGCRHVQHEIIKNSKHFVVNEQPALVAELIRRYASKGRTNSTPLTSK